MRIRHERRSLDLLERLRLKPIGDIRADPFLLGALERYLFLAAQASIDLAEQYGVLKGFGPATTMTQGFLLLQEHGIISLELADSLKGVVGFRNALVHGYENFDMRIVDDVLMTRLADLPRFADVIEAAL
jgi:uncharacterized protein YutE (UPF0331/DUF86 family)